MPDESINPCHRPTGDPHLPYVDDRPAWVKAFEGRAEWEAQREAAATVAMTQADDAAGAGSVREPADPSQPWREVWGRDADAEPEPFEPTGEGPLTDLLVYEQVQARCNGDCPTPGDCAQCNAALDAELTADPAIAASIAEWQRTSGPGPDPASLGWRRLDADAQADFLRWAEDQLAVRLAIGEQEYQSHIYGFQGDPLEHLIKEQLDGLFYSWQELRRRNAERNAIDDRGLLILWRLYCDDAGVAQSTADDRNRIDTFVAWLDDHCADAYNANLPALREAWQRFIIGNREFTVAP